MGQQGAIAGPPGAGPVPSAPGPSAPVGGSGLYPSLEDEYMGLQLTQYRPPPTVRETFTCLASPESVFTYMKYIRLVGHNFSRC